MNLGDEKVNAPHPPQAGHRSPSRSKRLRIRALQEILLNVNDAVLFAVDELEAIRSGRRLSQKARSR